MNDVIICCMNKLTEAIDMCNDDVIICCMNNLTEAMDMCNGDFYLYSF